MKNRREFIKKTAIGSLGVVSLTSCADTSEAEQVTNENSGQKPIVISTWDHGMVSNTKSWEILEKSGSALDAVEAGVRVVESDPKMSSVGYGGLPDRDGNVTLDACIMNHQNQCGSVAFLQNIENPISVARKVMETTPHVMLAGKGAYDFAIQSGFEHKNLLTPESEAKWKKWMTESNYEPVVNIENHDTIGALALDASGNLSGACTTSGLAYKLHGRVGDSPIIGAGLFVDNEIGAACATGVGEMVIRVAGTAIVVEMMRNGKSPQEACEEAVRRVIQKHATVENMQVGFLALDKYGNYGAYSIYEGFSCALTHQNRHELVNANFESKT